MRSVGACSAGSSTTSPRWIASLVMPSPARLSAQRSPASPRSVGRFCAWIERTRAGRPDGLTVTRSPTVTAPDSTVPVTTVPVPASVNERSTARRKRPCAARAPVPRAVANRRARRSSMPSPVTTETGRISAPASPVGVSVLAISVSSSARRALSARSALVSATMPRVMPSRSTIARCSRVCGITPSSAATTSSTKSMPVAPASMLCTNFSWPGTSTKPRTPPSGAGR